MGAVETEHVFEGTIDVCFEGIRQYQKYPEYLPGVTKVDVLPPKKPKSTCQVRYEVNIVKTFYYVIDMYEEGPGKIWWELAESNLMKENRGGWELKAKGKTKTEAHYTVEVAFKGLLPSSLIQSVTKATLPTMIEGFQKLIKDHKKEA